MFELEEQKFSGSNQVNPGVQTVRQTPAGRENRFLPKAGSLFAAMNPLGLDDPAHVGSVTPSFSGSSS